MSTNLDRYQKDLIRLNKTGIDLYNAMQRQCFKDDFDKIYKKEYGQEFDSFVKGLPNFNINIKDGTRRPWH